MPLTSELTLASSPRAAADARRWVGDICRRLERDDLVECAELGVSELVANAIIHADAPFKVRVRGTASHPRIEVEDGSTSPPVPPAPVPHDDLDLLLTFGRGLAMVAQCALAWGATIENDGKIVWFEPAPQMSDAASAEWVIDHHDEPGAEPTSEAAVEVRLLGMDVPLYTSLAQQYNELRRELRLLSLSHQSDYPLAGDLTAMFANFERQFPDSYRDQVQVAERKGQPRVDLSFAMVREAAPIFTTMSEMFDVADAFCRAERLLSMARTPRQRDLQNWLLAELVHQLGGAEATPWAGPPPEGTRTSQVG
ncbi:anti-sigma regulatory factor (Ser/Thr protein kinase) [Nocardioides sp. BE266]|uniref:ATP-binding protein n=1 Tax=Nocardioides sp. BE266 TaxID=2817725 RepID=UPI002855F518|nr:ATP-binding protein [Nocardioides sp. BE266]MDR7252038.1 anti-sigma regulatory factor (Ser/Thr protein kinase) [Nocardioides sp. BE266]